MAASPDSADGLAIEHLQSTGWSKVELEERGEVDIESLNGDADLTNAYERCLASGSAGIIFEDPIE